MRKDAWPVALLLLVALADCRDEDGGEEGRGAPRPAGPTQTLTGLYEGGEGPRRNQLCMIEREGRSASFGLVVWGPEDRSCGGSGLVSREGERLRLRLDGDDSCTLDARIEGGRVTLPETVAAECARYYCGEQVRLDGATFDKVGGAEDEALRATDLVGDRLCAR